MSGDGGTLESLHGVNQHLLHKLEGVGVQSISDLATKTVSELLKDYYSNYDDSRGVDEETISNIVILFGSVGRKYNRRYSFVQSLYPYPEVLHDPGPRV